MPRLISARVDLDYATIFDAAFNGMAFSDSESGRILDVNSAWIQATGIERARGSLYLSQKSMTPEDRARFTSLIGLVNMHYANMARELGKAIELNPALKANLGSLAAESAQLAESAMKLAREKIINVEQLEYAGPEYFKFFTQVIDAQFKLNGTALEELDQVLLERINAPA